MLSALLHELQHANSPLAQARILARAWRTVRELSPTDRRLLARHAGFEGAEQILEGLSERKGGLAPAMLLQALANARDTDGRAVSELLASLRDPRHRDEAISMGADLAFDFLGERETAGVREKVGEALVELQAVEASIVESAQEGAADRDAPESEAADLEGSTAPETVSEESGASDPKPEPDPEATTDAASETEPEPDVAPDPILEPERPSRSPVVDWSRWDRPLEGSSSEGIRQPEQRTPVSDLGPRRFEARAIMEAMGAAPSPLSQLTVLRREVSGFKGSSLATLCELVESFADGWARRRAVCALLEEGIPADAGDALEVVSRLGREVDRRWCLGLLARRRKLRGAVLHRALDLVDSKYAKRRLTALVR